MIVGAIGFQRGRALAVALVGLLLVALAAGVPSAGAQAAPPAPVQVIVQKLPAAGRGPELAVQRLGGRVTQALPLVAGFAATLPGARAAAELAASPGVRAVTPDRKVRVQAAAATTAVRSAYTSTVRADDVWPQGVTGQGVTVALIDTGVASVPDLAGRLVTVTEGVGKDKPCKNLSGELNCDDSYGHGTFVAGLIAGNGASSGGKWKGVAPGARVLSVKIAGAKGAADVSNVLAAIQWVVSLKDKYGIRVLNLSLGTDSVQSYTTDPLNYAVERAWAAGVVSGTVALMLQANPSLTPDRVKHVLTATARGSASVDPLGVGAGTVDAYAAAFDAPSGLANVGLGRSSGRGNLGASRGTVQTVADDPLGTVLGPVLTVQLLLWNPLGYTGGGWRESDWYLSTWNVFRFYRVGWYGSDWPGNRWRGSSWYGEPNDESYGSGLPGSAWYGAWE